MRSCLRRTAGLPGWATLLFTVCICCTIPAAAVPGDPRLDMKFAPDGQPLVQSSNELLWQAKGRDDVGTRHIAVQNDLPGRYDVKVITPNYEGIWNQVEKGLTLTSSHSKFHTGWLWLLCGMGLLASLFLLRLRRMSLRFSRELEERFNARLEERTRIAHDLHDSLLQGFQGLMFRLQAARQLLPLRASEAAAHIDTALKTVDKAIAEGRHGACDLRELSLIQGELSTTLARAPGSHKHPTVAAPELSRVDRQRASETRRTGTR